MSAIKRATNGLFNTVADLSKVVERCSADGMTDVLAQMVVSLADWIEKHVNGDDDVVLTIEDDKLILSTAVGGGIARLQEADKLSKAFSEEVEREANKSLETIEREHILLVLNHHKWNKSKSADILGIERSTLDRKLARYGVSRPSV